MRQYIIDFVNSATEDDINQYLADCGATILKTFSAFEKVVLVESPSEPPANELVEHVKDDEDHTNHIKLLTTVPVEFPSLSSDGAKTIVTTDQKDWWKVYSGSVVDLDAPSFELPLSGAGATVYMMDSGIKIDHPDFEGADIDLLYSFTSDFADVNGHGTALSSLVVGKTCGITNAKLKVVKIFDKNVPTKLSDFLSALDAIYADFSSANTYGIVNCSWEIARNEYVESKLRTLWLSGVQIVVAAGNTGTDIGNVTPAAMPEALVVGSYNASLTPCDFSDYTGPISVTTGTVNGGKLSGWAPGENIYVATIDGGYDFVSGTSVSAAIHSAIIAYNATLPAFQFDDTVNVFWQDSTRNNISFFVKRDLLLLNDPKYQDSPNLCSCLITDLLDPYKNTTMVNGLFTAIPVGRISRSVLFKPDTVSSVTLHDPLPDGMTLNNHGILSAYVPNPVQGDESSPNRVNYFISLTVVDLEGNSTDGTLEIAVMNIAPENIPTDPNELIPYTLNIDCQPLTVCGSDITCFSTGCPGVGSCTCGFKSQCSC